MKKLFSIILMFAIFLLLSGCNFSSIEVGSKDGVAFFNYTDKIPKITLTKDENELLVEDDVFFEKLVSCIDGKTALTAIEAPYYQNYIYVVEIGKYDFALHDEHIFIYSPLGYNIKGVEIICVECTQEEISGLVEILDVVK